MTHDEIDRLVKQRDEVRAQGDWVAADSIRQELLSLRDGLYRLTLLDEPGGTFWYWTAT